MHFPSFLARNEATARNWEKCTSPRKKMAEVHGAGSAGCRESGEVHGAGSAGCRNLGEVHDINLGGDAFTPASQ